MVAAGSLAVHELRYAVGYGENAGSVLAAQGHSYLSWAGPLLAVVVAVACGAFIARLASASTRSDEPSVNTGRVWVAASSSLTAIYVMQETLEGYLANGHPGGIAGVLGNGGWTAAVFALAIGAVIALLLRGAHAVTEAAARLLRPTFFGLDAPIVSFAGRPAPTAPRPGVLARHLAGRAPPLTS